MSKSATCLLQCLVDPDFNPSVASVSITDIIFSSVRERAVACESCNLIGSGSGQNFPISDHGHGNRTKTMNENSNTAKLGKFLLIFGYKMRIFVNSQFSHVL